MVPIGLAAATLLSLSTGSPAAASVDGPCAASFNGVDATIVDDLDSPLELQDGDILTFHGTDDVGTRSASVDVILGPIAIQTGETTYGPLQQDFSASIDLDDVTPYGVGLFRIHGVTDNCTVDAWMRVGGRYPFATLTGLTGGGLALGGLAAQLASIASRRRWSPTAAAIAGLATGAGGATVAQQFGRLQMSYISLGTAAGGAALLGAIVAAILAPRSGLGFVARRRAEAAQKRAIRYQARLEAARLDADRREAEARAVIEAEQAAAGEGPAADPARPGPVTIAASPDEIAAAEPQAIPQPRPEAPEGPYWCYVMAPVDVLDLSDHTRVVGSLQPGTWYLAKRRIGSWVQVAVGDGLEGWAPNSAVNKHG